MTAPPQPRTAPCWRDFSTRELLDEQEYWRWLAADLASNPATQYPADSQAYIQHKLDGIASELGRREAIRHHPLAPLWPADPVHQRAELNQIRAALSVKDFFARYTPVVLHRSGEYWRGCCPIHDGDNPESFIVSDRWYRCYACGASGDLFRAAMQVLDLDFSAAVDVLAVAAGIDRRPLARPNGSARTVHEPSRRGAHKTVTVRVGR